MSNWGYRVVKKDGQLEIHGVYYNEKGKIIGTDAEANFPFGADLEELRKGLELMIESLEKPILDFENLKEIK